MATENYGIFYNKLHDYINRLIGKPETPNPDYDQDESHEKYIWSQAQADAYDEFISILREFQLEVSEPISNITKISANAFTRSVEKGRDRVLDTVRRTNKTAANSISRIPPSSTSLFGGDHSKLEKVAKLSKDLRGSGFLAFRNFHIWPATRLHSVLEEDNQRSSSSQCSSGFNYSLNKEAYRLYA